MPCPKSSTRRPRYGASCVGDSVRSIGISSPGPFGPDLVECVQLTSPRLRGEHRPPKAVVTKTPKQSFGYGRRPRVRGTLHAFGLADSPLTRIASAMRSDLSPQAGRGKLSADAY